LVVTNFCFFSFCSFFFCFFKLINLNHLSDFNFSVKKFSKTSNLFYVAPFLTICFGLVLVK
jgi:hypothetical protein